MVLPSQLLFLLVIYLCLYPTSNSTNSSSTCSELDKNSYENWLNLPTLNATLGYTHNPKNASLSVVFMATPPSPKGWIAWGINPNGQGMVGAEIFAAFRKNNIIEVKTFRLESYADIEVANLSFDNWDVRGESVGDVMMIYVKVKVPDNVEAVNQTWQIGPDVVDGMLRMHSSEDPNKNSKGRLCLLGADSCDPAVGKKITHAIMSTLGWGVLQLIEIFLERCRNKYSSPSRILVNLHNICQLTTYIIGIMGCGVGLILENESELIQSRIHSTVGITIIWISTTKLIFAWFLRRNNEKKYKTCWKLFTYTLGYGLLGMGIIEIHTGSIIFDLGKPWEYFYNIVIFLLFVFALIFEVIIRR